jgi:epsilon-lactone hydrolase
MNTMARKAFAGSMAVLAVISIALTVCVASAQEADKGWHIGPRTLPPPAGASAQLRKMLADRPAPSAPPSPTTVDAWKQHIAAADAAKAKLADTFVKRAKLDVVEETLAGVPVYRLTPQIAPEHANQLFVHPHGGAFIVGNATATLPEAAQIAAFLKMPVLSIDSPAGT